MAKDKGWFSWPGGFFWQVAASVIATFVILGIGSLAGIFKTPWGEWVWILATVLVVSVAIHAVFAKSKQEPSTSEGSARGGESLGEKASRLEKSEQDLTGFARGIRIQVNEIEDALENFRKEVKARDVSPAEIESQLGGIQRKATTICTVIDHKAGKDVSAIAETRQERPDGKNRIAIETSRLFKVSRQYSANGNGGWTKENMATFDAELTALDKLIQEYLPMDWLKLEIKLSSIGEHSQPYGQMIQHVEILRDYFLT